MLKMEDASRIMKPGFINVVAIKNQKLNTIETVFIIKDFNYKLEKLMKSHYANVRATVQGNEKANGLIFMTRFSGMKNKIYHSWFDKTLQVNELFYLINQERLQYFLVDEKNKQQATFWSCLRDIQEGLQVIVPSMSLVIYHSSTNQ